ncbi:MAG: hypothetical protein U0S36_15710 [Candidatus Nanopelagicales bacterium]
MSDSLAARLASTIASKDHAALADLLHPEIDFRGMTPGRTWEADGPDDVVAAVAQWFEDSDVIEAVEAVETDEFADRQRAGYRFRVRNDDGLHLVEQQAYLSERDGRIGWLRVLCSGFRSVD